MLQTVWFWDSLGGSRFLSCLLKFTCTSELGGVSHERAELYNELRASTPIPPHVLSDFASATRPPPCFPILLRRNLHIGIIPPLNWFHSSWDLKISPHKLSSSCCETFEHGWRSLGSTVKTLTTMYNNAIFWPDPSVYYIEPLAKKYDTGFCSLGRAHMHKMLKFTIF